MKLHAKYWDGEFYPAEVVTVAEGKKRAKAPVKVHYVGFDGADTWLPLEDLKSKVIKNAKSAPKAKAKVKAKAKAKDKAKRPLPSIKLTYFNIEGVAEKVRLAFALSKVEFEDKRISFDGWKDLKPKTKYGQLPMMQIGDDEPFAQSGAMVRWAGRLARRANLYPPRLILKIEEAIGLEEDISKAIMPSIYMGMYPQNYGYPEDMPKEERTKVQLALRAKLIEKPDGQLIKMLGYLEAFIGDNDYMCGKSPTIADCQVVPKLRHLTKGILDGIPTTLLDDFPKLKAYSERFYVIPEVKSWYEKLSSLS
jgi:glutathione S-transferase